MSVKLGDICKDKITGFSGVVTGHAVYLNNCDRFCLQPQELKEDGSIKGTAWFDESQLEILGHCDVPVIPPFEHHFKLLDKVEDLVTGHKGVITAFTNFLSGCVRAGIQNKEKHKGRPVDDYLVPVQQLCLLERPSEDTVETMNPSPKQGGPMRDPSGPKDYNQF